MDMIGGEEVEELEEGGVLIKFIEEAEEDVLRIGMLQSWEG